MSRMIAAIALAIGVLVGGSSAMAGAAATAATAPAATAPATPAPAATAAPATPAPPATAVPAPAAAAQAKAPVPAPKVVATVKSIEGTVEARPAVGQPWKAVAVGDQLAEGTDLRTGFRARCTLEMEKNAVQVEPLSVIRIGELRREGQALRTRILMKQGNTQAAVDKGGVENDFAIVTPSATLSVRGTHVIHCGFFDHFGGQYGLTQSGLLNLANNATGANTGVGPGEQTDDGATPPIFLLSQNFRPFLLDLFGYEGWERDAAQRWHTSTPLPAALGGPLGLPFVGGIHPPGPFGPQPPTDTSGNGSYYDEYPRSRRP